MKISPIAGFLGTLLLFATRRVNFIRKDVGQTITMEDGQTFRVFRHVRIASEHPEPPAGVFVVRFKPNRMSIKQNIWFSLLPMLFILGFPGFREKYWCVDDKTGLCQGVYAWQKVGDAENYARSLAMRFMTNRSDPKSVSARVIDQGARGYWLFYPPEVSSPSS